MIPQFAQTEIGYTAELAGKLLSPGGFAIILIMPIIGNLVSRVDARYLIGAGLVISALALFHMTNIYAGIDFRSLMLVAHLSSFGDGVSVRSHQHPFVQRYEA